MEGVLTENKPCMLCVRLGAQCQTCGFVHCKEHSKAHKDTFCTTDERIKAKLLKKFRYGYHVPYFHGYFGFRGRVAQIGNSAQCIFCGAISSCFGLFLHLWRYCVCLECGFVCDKNCMSEKECAEYFEEVQLLFFVITNKFGVVKDVKRKIWNMLEMCTNCHQYMKRRKYRALFDID
jgi:hypothetical protein